MNKVTLLGYISQDPITKEYPDKGFVVSRFSIAVNDMKNYNLSFFFNCVAWNQTAEYVQSHLKKGNFVAIDGRLTNRSYINDSGAKTYITEINVDNIKNLGSRSSNKNQDASEEVDLNTLLDKSQKTINLDESLQNNEVSSNAEDVFVDWEDDIE